MAVTRADVEHVAELARLGLTDDELDVLVAEMNSILLFFEDIRRIDTEGIEPAFRALRRLDVLREDAVSDSLTREEALANAPDRAGDSFRVPAFLPEG